MMRRGFLFSMLGASLAACRKDKAVAYDMDYQVVEEMRGIKEADETHASLEAMAKAAEPDALKRKDELLAQYVAEMKRQVDGWSFECKKYGDFLTIFITQNGNAKDLSSIGSTRVFARKFSTTLNMAQVRTTDLKLGNPADGYGELSYDVGLEGGGGFSPGMGDVKLTRGSYVVSPRFDSVPESRAVFQFAPESSRNSGVSVGSYLEGYRINYKTKPFPRGMVQDEIVFVGLGATIYAPSGVGGIVHRRILDELAGEK